MRYSPPGLALMVDYGGGAETMDREGVQMSDTAETFEQCLRRAIQQLEQGQLEGAYVWAAQALALRPANQLAQNLLGLLAFRQGQYSRALEIFEALVRRNLDVITLRVNAGLAAYRLNRLPQALEHFRRAIDLDPSYSRAFGYLALVHLMLEEFDLARAALQEAGLDQLASRIDHELEGELAAQLTQEIEQKIEGLLLCSEGASPPPSAFDGFAEISRVSRGMLAPRIPLGSVGGSRRSTLDLAVVPAEEDFADTLEDTGVPLLAAEVAVSSSPLPIAQTAEPALELIAEPLAATASADDELFDNIFPAEESPLFFEAELPPAGAAKSQGEIPVFASAESLSLGEEASSLEPVPVEPVNMSAPRRRASAASPSTEVKQLLAYSLPAPDLTPPAVLQDHLLTLRLSVKADQHQDGSALIRDDLILWHRGELQWNRVARRRKGAAQDPFTVEQSLIMRLAGQGIVVLHPGVTARFELLELLEEALFLRESCLAACSGLLHWENGRLPGHGAAGPGIVYLSGQGFLALRVPGRLGSCRVAQDETLTVSLAHLVGWSGRLVPQVPESRAGALVLGFQGAGMVMLAIP
jgi:tetratricopeptide (TPR) repeat protein